MKFLIAIILSAIAFFSQFSSSYAQGAQDYDYLWESTNVYIGETLWYSFSSLTSTSTYQFTLQQIDENGALLQTLQVKTVSGTTDSLLGFANVQVPGMIFTGNNFAILRVIDNFGNVLGTHLTTSNPTVVNSLWSGSGGANDEKYKTGIGNTPYKFTLNAGGYQHDEDDILGVTTIDGEYTLLHYRLEDVDPIDEYIEISNIETNTVVATIYLEDLANYQWHRDLSPVSPGVQARNNFVLINTNGEIPTFIDAAQDAFAFTTGDDPHSLNLSTGIYDYARFDSTPTQLAIGESVWIITDGDPDIAEWTLEPTTSVVETQNQELTITAKNLNVWNAYGVRVLVDSIEGTISTPSTFATETEISYAVDTATEDVGLTYTRKALALNYGDPDDFSFIFTATYDIVDKLTWEEEAGRLIDEKAENNGINRNVILLGILGIGILFVMFLAVDFGVPIGTIGSISFIGLSSIFIIRGYFALWVSIPLAFICVLLLFAMIKQRTSNVE